MEVLIKVNSQTAGRDKIARIVQYASRLIWSELQKNSTDRYTIDQLKRLESTCSSFRKVLRFGRCVDSLHSTLATINYPDYMVRATLTSSKLCNTVFLFSDHILWLAKSGFLKNVDANKWSDLSNRYWLFSIAMNLIRDIYEVVRILAREKDFIFGTGSASSNYFGLIYYIRIIIKAFSVIKMRKDVVTDTVKNLCDIWIPLAALGRVNVHPSTVGLLGTISSLAALLPMIQPAVKLSPA